MARVRNAVGIVAEVTDAEADLLSRRGWSLVEAPKPAASEPKPDAAPKRRASTKKD